MTRDYAWICFALIEVKNKLCKLDSTTPFDNFFTRRSNYSGVIVFTDSSKNNNVNYFSNRFPYNWSGMDMSLLL
jgi:hypothetical protein